MVFSLDDKRNPISDNDIPDIISRFRNLDAESERNRTDQSFLVPVEEIREHAYDLAFNTYKETIREKVEYDAPEVILGRIAEIDIRIANSFNRVSQLINHRDEA